MKDTTFALFYLVTSMFGVYVVKLFMGLFFTEEGVNKKREFISYFLYYAIPTAIYLFVDIPVLNLFLNISFWLIITLNYRSTWKKRFLCMALMLVLFTIVESIVALACGFVQFNVLEHTYYASLLSLICSPLMEFMLIQCLLKYRNLKKEVSMPVTYWIAIIFVPFVSFYLMVKIFSCGAFGTRELFICSVLVLGVNLIIFGLYDRQIMMFEQEKQAQFLRAQNNLLESQIELIKTSHEMTKSMRHDWKNHVHAICQLIEQGKYQEVRQYSEKMKEHSGEMLNRANSGNLIVDSILNFKLYEASKIGADVKLEMESVEQIEIEPFDLNIVFSNLLDNAIEAIRKVDNPFLHVRVKQRAGRFVLEIVNSYTGEIEAQDKMLKTSKENQEFHGIGLKNVKGVLEKYNGMLEIDYADNVFHSVAIWNLG